MNLYTEQYYAKSGEKVVFPEFWKRKNDFKGGVIQACVLEMSYRNRPPNQKYDGRKECKEVAIIELFCCDKEGRAFLIHAHDFRPYFYCSIPENFPLSRIDDFKNSLSKSCSKAQDDTPILSIEIVKKRSIMFYQDECEFFKIETQIPGLVKTCRTNLEENKLENFTDFSFHTFESNVDFVLRFMCDHDITGTEWIEIPEGTYEIRQGNARETVNQIEIDCNYKSIKQLGTDGEWMSIPPLRILSFDIEVGGELDHFPTSDKDPVIQVCSYIAEQGNDSPMIAAAFILGKASPIDNAALYQFETESDLLLNFQAFLQFVDPDVITGYNIERFDLPYLVERASHLNITPFRELGRFTKEYSTSKSVQKGTKQLGTRDSKEVTINGRIQLDMYINIKNDNKLRSYTLNAVSSHFLGDQKEDVHFSIINKLQNGTDDDRRRLAIYCLKDSYLPLQLLNKTLALLTTVELARVCRVPMSYILNRGQQIRVFSQIMHKARERNMIIPATKSQDTDHQFEGATVIDPKEGFYKQPIPTLDFNSLYPSIMIAHNLCYSTLLYNEKYNVDFTLTPNGKRFVKESVFPGVLPEILRNLLVARKNTKKLMEQETDPMRKNVFNKRQLAIKVSANSVYGFTGATVGRLPCLDISEAVTSFGRSMIKRTKRLVEEYFTEANNFPHNASVIYGDTDSVMVNFGDISIQDAINIGKQAAEYVSSKFQKPINIEFEKAYFPFLLLAKKHYAGLLYTRPDKYDRIDAKGIETVRRDNCMLVQNVVKKSLDLLLIEKDEDKATSFVKKIVSDLNNDRIDLSFLIISKTLSKKEYDSKQPHFELAKKLEKRDKGSAPRMGDRIPFLIVSNSKERISDKAEDPLYVIENGIQIDVKHYIEQLEKPLERIYKPVIGNKTRFLLEGEHTRTKKIPRNRSINSDNKKGTLFSFGKTSYKCLSCRSKIDKGSYAVCSQCLNKVVETYIKVINNYRFFESEYSKLWTNCQRCQNSYTNANICSASDCPVFYRRMKLQFDIEDISKDLARFNEKAPAAPKNG